MTSLAVLELTLLFVDLRKGGEVERKRGEEHRYKALVLLNEVVVFIPIFWSRNRGSKRSSELPRTTQLRKSPG